MNMFKPSVTKILFMVVLSFMSSLTIAEGVRVRGELIKLTDNLAEIKSSVGQNIQVKLDTNYKIAVYRNIEFKNLQKNSYLSIPSISIGNGKRRALGINVFPDAMRNYNEGFSEWDLTPDSKMTNATLAQVISRNENNEIEVRFGEKTQTIVVERGTPITTFAVDSGATLKVGQKIVVFAKDVNGALNSGFVGVHIDGHLPPI